MKKFLIIPLMIFSFSLSAVDNISIKGDARFRYSYKQQIGGERDNYTDQLLRLHLAGKTGNTTVKVGLRNDGGTRVSNGVRGAPGGTGGGSGLGLREDPGDPSDAILTTDYLYITTKLGPINFKAGDWWDTTGLALIRQKQDLTEAVELSTQLDKINLAIRSVPGVGDVWFTASTKFQGFQVVFQHLADPSDVDNSATNTNRGFTDIMVKGKISGFDIGAEYFAGKEAETDASLIHIQKKIYGITYHFARADWEKHDNGWNNVKYTGPLALSFLGQGWAPVANGGGALTDINRGTYTDSNGNPTDTSLTGVRADAKLAGIAIQLAAGRLDLGEGQAPGITGNLAGKSKTFTDLILKRKLGKGAILQASYGDYANSDTLGTQLTVKF